MAAPEPNPYVGSGVMLIGLSFILWTVWQCRVRKVFKIVGSLLLCAAVVAASIAFIRAQAEFDPHFTSAVVIDHGSFGTVIQPWADIENTGNKAGLVKQWHLKLTLADGQTEDGQVLYGQRAVDASGKELPPDSLEDKTENVPVPSHAHPKGYLFFHFTKLPHSSIVQDQTKIDLWVTSEDGREFHAKPKTVGDVKNDKRSNR